MKKIRWTRGSSVSTPRVHTQAENISFLAAPRVALTAHAKDD